jgi:NAD(P)H-hydrate epimerase
MSGEDLETQQNLAGRCYMKYYVNGKQAREIDRYTSEHVGIPSIVLMERAALELANAVLEEPEKNRASVRILSVVGGGNNGGDAVAAARILKSMGFDTAVYEVNKEAKKTESFLVQEKIARNLGVKFLCEEDIDFTVKKSPDTGEGQDAISALKSEFSKYEVIIDGIFGVGLTREVEGVYRTAVEAINAVCLKRPLVVGCDIPSGIDADTGIVMGCAVKCDITVTFEYIKFGMLVNEGRTYSGRILRREIGLYTPRELTEAKRLFEGVSAFEFDEADARRIAPKQKPDSNKGTNGKVLMVAGSKDIYGALYLCSSACFRVGAGLVKVVTHEVNRTLLMDKLPEAMMLTYSDGDLADGHGLNPGGKNGADVDNSGNGAETENSGGETGGENGSEFLEKLASSVAWADVILVGPGLGTGPQSAALLKSVIASLKEGQRLVLDADALNIIFNPEVLNNEGALDGINLREDGTDPLLGNDQNVGEVIGVRDVIQFINRRIGRGNTVITPHIGEMIRVIKGLGEETTTGEIKRNPAEAALFAARETGAVVVLKDARTVVADPGEERLVYVNTTGNSGMSKGGSGDVLAGITAGLLARNMRVTCQGNEEKGADPLAKESISDIPFMSRGCFETACLSVNLHGRAGDRAKDDVGETCMLAGNILDKL